MKTNLPFYNFMGIMLFLAFFSTEITAQTLSDFESFGLSAGEFNNNAMSAGFEDGNLFLPNNNTGFWNGWAISAQTDTETAGFTNDLSSITGSGEGGSTSYAVSFQFGSNYLLPIGAGVGGDMQGMYISNGTYPYLSMRDGDGFAKRFGGETGDDPDFFLLTIKGYLNGVANADSIDFYLADYRFNDNSMDYILDTWNYINLSPLGNVDSLSFTLSSSDNGEFGMNTPGYFCIDNFTTTDVVATRDILVEQLSVFPNPATDKIQLVWPYQGKANGELYNMNGQLVSEWAIGQGENSLNIENLPSGIYSLICEGDKKVTMNKIVKK